MEAAAAEAAAAEKAKEEEEAATEAAAAEAAAALAKAKAAAEAKAKAAATSCAKKWRHLAKENRLRKNAEKFSKEIQLKRMIGKFLSVSANEDGW